MQRIRIFLFFLLITPLLFAQQTPEQIRSQMASIRRSTNWNDPLAAKKANEQIKELSKKLMRENVIKQPGNNYPNNKTSPKDVQKLNRLNQEMIDQKSDVYSEVSRSAAAGNCADILMARPLRQEIVNDYIKEEKSKYNQRVLEEQKVLFIDFSKYNAHNQIEMMDSYSSIKTLILYGGQFGAPVNLSDILRRARSYPLEELYIINFRIFVTSVPPEISQFTQLRYLSLFNNQLDCIPQEVLNMSSLKNLFIDINPIATLLPAPQTFQYLDTLGISKTNIPTAEVEVLKHMFPDCKIIY